MLTDMDGDGFVDVVHLDPKTIDDDPVEQKALANTGAIRVHLGHGGTSFGDMRTWAVPPYTSEHDPGEWNPPASDPNVSYGWTRVSPTARLVDFNNDGLADLIFSSAAGLQVALNTGRGFAAPIALGVHGAIETEMTVGHHDLPVYRAFKFRDGKRFRHRFLFDIDGDHRLDLVELILDSNQQPTGNALVRVNTGAGFAPAWIQMAGIALASNTFDLLAAAPGSLDERSRRVDGASDLDDDGIPELSTWSASGQVTYSDDVSAAPLRVLTTINNGRGLSTQITYASANSPAVREDASSSDYVQAPPIWVVSSISSDPGAGQPTMRTQYKFASPVFSSRGGTEAHHFVGFGHVRTIGSTPSGAAGGSEHVKTYGLNPVSAELELSEDASFRHEVAGLFPSTITRYTFGTYSLFDGLLAVRLANTTITWTCLTSQRTEAECTGGGILRMKTQSWLQYPTTGSAKLYLADTTEERAPQNLSDSRRAKVLEYDVRYPSPSAWHSYYILSKTTATYSPAASQPVEWPSTSLVQETFNTYGQSTLHREWTGPNGSPGVPYADTAHSYDSLGNLTSVTRPSQVAAAGTATV